MIRFYISLFCLLLCCQLLFAQNKPKQDYSLPIKRAVDEIRLDGVLDEKSWEEANLANHFYQNFPYDTSYAKTKTEAMVTYNQQYLYIAAKCYDEVEGDFVVQSLKRDFSYPRSDAFAVYLDPFNDQTNGFSFAVNPLGVQREGLLANGGSFGVTTSWDNKWFSKVVRYDGYWVVEMAIPFKTIRFNPEVAVWRINFSRNDLKRNENSSWVPVPRGYNIASMAFNGVLEWDVQPSKTGLNLSLIPYGTAGFNSDYENDETNYPLNAGGDAKIAISSALNLDLTFNPDFSQVEVDRQVTNLSRFSIFFPERRNFFIENSDLFSQWGFSRIRPFFSRRIGLYKGQQVPIWAGARLSGKLTNSTRIGVLNMQTAASDTIFSGGDTAFLPAQNYTVITAQQQVLGRSYVGFVFVNRQGFNEGKWNGDDFNRVAGIDFNLQSKDNRWRGKIFYHQSFDKEKAKGKGAHAVWLRYEDPKWFFEYNHEYVGDNYNADVGFVLRKGVIRTEDIFRRRFYPKDSKINFHGPGAYADIYWDHEFNALDKYIEANYQIKWESTAELNLYGGHVHTRLRNPFDITNTGQTPLAEGDYYYYQGGVGYTSDYRKRLSYSGSVDFGTYFQNDITKLTYSASVNYRWQPIGNLALDFERNEIRMPENSPYKSTFLTLIGPRFEFSFTRSIFLTTFFQYNTQINNFNINARFQWRFKPMSDLFIVYTDNYDTRHFAIKNRALVLKLTYWFTL